MSLTSRRLFLDKTAGWFSGLFSEPKPRPPKPVMAWRSYTEEYDEKQRAKANAMKWAGEGYHPLAVDAETARLIAQGALLAAKRKSYSVPDMTIGQLKAGLKDFTADPSLFQAGDRMSLYSMGNDVGLQYDPVFRIMPKAKPVHSLMTKRGKLLSDQDALVTAGLLDAALFLKKGKVRDDELLGDVLTSEYAPGQSVLDYVYG